MALEQAESLEVSRPSERPPVTASGNGARCLGNKLQSGGYLKSNNYTTLLYELIDLVKEMYNSTSRVT